MPLRLGFSFPLCLGHVVNLLHPWSPDLTVSGPPGLRTGVGTLATPCARCTHLQGHALSCL